MRETAVVLLVVTFVDRETRQIVGHKVSESKAVETIQAITDSAPKAENCHSDGYSAYKETLYYNNHYAYLNKSVIPTCANIFLGLLDAPNVSIVL